MSNKIDKADLKSPDQVTQTLRKGFVWTTSHSKIVISAFMAFVVIGGGWALLNMFSHKNELAQQEKYYVLERALNEKQRGYEEAKRSEEMAIQAKKTKEAQEAAAKKPTGDLEKDYGNLIGDLNAFIANDAGSMAAQMAALRLSDLYVEYDKTPEALSVLEKVEKSLGRKDVLTGLVLLKKGSVQANQNQCEAAIQTWTKITDNKSLNFAHSEAKIRMGVCYESLQDLAKAENLYKEVVNTEESESNYAVLMEAKKYLKLIKAKQNL